MREFNSTDLLTGYIKQLLASFNLPKIRVYTKAQQDYHDYAVEYNKKQEDRSKIIPTERFDVLETVIRNEDEQTQPDHVRYFPYIKGNKIKNYVNGQWEDVGEHNEAIGKHLHHYSYGVKLLNYTKKLRINNNIYDSYTHEYLGDYLRFIRDYKNIDLMSLYNCFSNRACPNLKITGSYKNGESENAVIHNLNFDTSDSRYKIYMVPVKLFTEYTIAIDSNAPIELCCGIYGEYQDTRDKLKNIPILTYQKISHSTFSSPFIYSGVLNLNDFTLKDSTVELAQNEANLKLFIKLPASNNSTIVILEGNYLGWNDTLYTKISPKIFESPVKYFGHGKPSLRQNLEITIEGPSESYTEPVEDLAIGIGEQSTDYTNEDLYIDSNHVTGNWEIGDVYVDLDTCLLYTYGEDGWDNGKFIWSEMTTERDVISRVKTNGYNIVVDDYNYNIDYTPTMIIETYKRRHPETKITNKTLYLNTVHNTLISYPNAIWGRTTNNAIINVETIVDDNDIILLSPLQLLRMNTKKQHPFADRLIEYLFDNAITSDSDEISDNVKRAQKIVELNSAMNGYINDQPGLWDFKLNKIFYDYMTKKANTYEVNHDLLGYVDKDTEKYYAFYDSSKKASTSIMNAELNKEEK